MMDAPASLTPVTALIAFTALFAGLWGGDQTSPPASRQAVKVSPVSLAQDAEPPTPVPSEAVSTLRQGWFSVSVSVETEHLQIPESRLREHLKQLPFGMEQGDYRIVDSLGGVGWLRIRTSGDEPADPNALPLMTTRIGQDEVRFIRIARPVIGTASAGVSR